ncbi:MAG: ATP-binding cassette domain-containing protein [Alphaproteobacteria bacterium]|nr:ATP-binding cassette domain-containing protein [Alphaproteobacteria bacterium]
MTKDRNRPAVAPGTGDGASWPLVRRLLAGYVRPHAGRIWGASLCMAFAAAATAGNAWMMQPALDEVFLKRDATLLLLVPAAVIALALVKGLASYADEVLMTHVGQRIVAVMQQRMFAHLMGADLAFFHASSTGTLISRFTNDVQLLRGVLARTLTGIAKDSLTVAGLVGVMVYQDWRLAAVSLVVFPLAVLPVLGIGRRMRGVSTATQDEMGNFTTLLDQTFQGARHVKAYGMEGYESARAGASIERLFKLVYRAAKVRAAMRPIMETLGGIAVAIAILYGGSQVIEGTTTPGAFFSFVTALLLAYQPVKNLANLYASLQEGLAAAARVFAMLDLEPTIRDLPGVPDLVPTRGEITFADVAFTYGGERRALAGVTLSVPPGGTAALVGPSGAGKSTILNLIPRFYDVAAGRVAIDGVDVRDVTLASLRRSISLVSQETSLFDDSVAANIAYGRPDASEREIIQAARDAAAHDFIIGLPRGYDTEVGEHGVRLSGGQRQRIAIARAMLKNAPILLLDEATSALDNESERQVQVALQRLMVGRTTLIIAHRLSTIRNADVIYVVEDGRVVESGSHGALLQRGGPYARLHAVEARGEPAADAGEAMRVRA